MKDSTFEKTGGLTYAHTDFIFAKSNRFVSNKYSAKPQFKSWKCSVCQKDVLDDLTTRGMKRKICKDCQRKPMPVYKHYLPRPCEYCGNIFTPLFKSTTRHCGQPCRIRACRGIVLHSKCEECKTPIPIGGRRRFCTKKCQTIGSLKKKLLELTSN